MPVERTLHELVSARARAAPERVALRTPDERLTYAELDARADALARRLRAAGVVRETPVALCLDRGAAALVASLAILKAGGAYLPIDPGYPDARVGLLLADSGTRFAVAGAAQVPRLAAHGVEVVRVDAAGSPDPAMPASASLPTVDPADLAYVIYTSGSSGTPKGVAVEHQMVVRLFEATQPWFGFGAEDVWSWVHAISFDFSVWEVWGALLHGGRIVAAPASVVRTPAQLLDLIDAEGVTVLSQTPSAFRQLLASERRRPDVPDRRLRLVVFGGEALDIRALAPWIERYGDARPELVNMYGITETTVHVTYRPIRRADLETPDLSPIGVPIPDLEVALLDDAGHPVGVDEVGEIHVAGPGLARGYLNRPELTADRFVWRRDDGRAPRRWYRSGDLGQRLANGDLVYRGRTDEQVKVRGYRVEPREIEVCLAGHPGVAEAAVLREDLGDGDARLAAFIWPAATDPAALAGLCEELRGLAAADLPAHMRPGRIEVVGAFPLTPHGKLDKAALLAGRTHDGDRANGTEQPPADAILAIGTSVLQRPDLKATDDIFDLGATSLSLIRIIAEVNQRYGVNLNGSELGDEATLERLAACVAKARSGGDVRPA